jgi:WD40 repeat protein
MQCSTCGAPLEEDSHGLWCPRCAFDRAIAAGGAGPAEGGEPAAGPAGERYELLEELARGSMGVVWLARERGLDRLVALKLVAPESSPAWSARLLREGRAAASLRHPHIVAVHGMGGADATAYLAMEFIEGGGLDARLREGPIAFREAAEIARKVAGALAYAHQAGILHRDVKPSNILIDEAGEPRLADFGLAAPLEGAGDLTMPGHILGTPAYLAPELLRGSDKASPASDVYGLGAVLYACLTGRAPFVGDSAGEILAQLPTVEPTPPHMLRPGVPRDLETICLACLHKAPERRYASAALLQADLQAYLEGRSISARPSGWAERLGRACRRHPGFATSVAATTLCLLVLAIGGPLMAFRLARAQAAAQERLRDALLARSSATRLAARIGQRDDALEAAQEAARIRPGLDARDEAIAALARPEIVPLHIWPMRAGADTVASYDPDNDRYAFETLAGQLELHRLSDNSLLSAWAGPGERLWTYPVFSADGRYAAARNNAGHALVWREGRRDPVFDFKDRPYALAGRFLGYGQPDAFSPDGRMLASTLPASGVALVALEDGRVIAKIPTEAEATHVAYSGDGRWIAVGRGLLGRDGRTGPFLRVFDAATLREVSQPRIDAHYQSLTWSPGGGRILVTGERLDLYRASDGERLRSLNDPMAVRGFFGPQGSTLLSASQGGELTLWDLGAARPLLTGDVGSRVETAVDRTGELIAKSAGPDGTRLVRLEMSAFVHTWPSGSEGQRENVLSAAVSTVDYSPDGRLLATAIWGAVQLRDAVGSLLDSAELGTKSNYCSVRFSRDGKSLLAGTAEEGLLRIPIASAGARATLGTPAVVDSEAPEFITDVSRDGSMAVATSLITGFVKVVALDGGRTLSRWKLPSAAGAVFVDHDSGVLASSLDAGGGQRLEVRDAATGARVLRALPYPHGAHVNVSGDGRLVVAGSGGSATLLLRTEDWSRGAVLPAAVQGMEHQCAISPDGSTLAFGVGPRVWLVATADGSVLAHLEGAQGGTYLPGLTFSPDGSRLALLWETGQLTVWDLANLRAELRSRGLDWQGND